MDMRSEQIYLSQTEVFMALQKYFYITNFILDINIYLNCFKL